MLSPDFALNKFYPKYDYKNLDDLYSINLDPKKEVHIKTTRLSEYGERYKLFVIKKDTFENNYNFVKDKFWFFSIILILAIYFKNFEQISM